MFKFFTLFLITILLSACQSTSKVNSTPENIHNLQSATIKCEENLLTVNNYQSFIDNYNVKYIKNPFEDHCVPISFNKKEEHSEIVERVYVINQLEFQPILFDILSSEQTVENLNNAVFIYKYNNHFLQVLNYYYDKELHYNIFPTFNYDFSKEFFFIHELFHLTRMNLSSKKEQAEKEFLSDIGAIIVYSKKHKLNQTETYNVAWEIFKMRKNKALNNNVKRTHFYKNKWLSFIDNIENNNIDFDSISTFKEAYQHSLKYL